MSANQAAWLNEARASATVAPAEDYTPGPGEVVVRNEAIAFNPIEAKIQKYAVFPLAYPTIIGTSYAGTITKLGPSIPNLSINDRVAVSAGFGDQRFGAYQKYPLAFAKSLAKLPPNVSFADAAAAVANLKTVVGAMAVYMGLDKPDIDAGRKPQNGKKVLVYGGTSSVGGYAIQYLSDAGYDVISTFSPQHKEYVSTLGASHLVNHTLPQADQLTSLQSFEPYDAIFDAIGTPPVTNLLYKLLGPKGGVYYSTLPPMGSEDPAPEGVERKFESFGVALDVEENQELARWFWEVYLPRGLGEGRVQPTRVLIAEGGLGGVQGVLDRLNAGVSGRKLVLNPQA
ncbi:MAG: hypothetical protein M1839_005504 [Geoglossum umbratile]|nr:MAG: hypothetical protein M1839_005504 [Geoglossum umbratile]